MKGKDRIAGYKLIGKLPVPVFDVLEWAIWFEANPKARLVAKTMVGPLTVSTVFLGLDHGRGDRTILFETMVFGARDHLVELVPGASGCFAGRWIMATATRLGVRPRLVMPRRSPGRRAS